MALAILRLFIAGTLCINALGFYITPKQRQSLAIGPDASTFITPQELPFFKAVLIPTMIYLAINPIEKTKIVLKKVEELLRVGETNNKFVREELMKMTDEVQPNGIGASPEQRERINELVSLLETNNPTPRPATSSMNSGRWRMVYTDYCPAGPSSGKLGPFIGDVFQQLSPELGVIENILDIKSPPIQGKLVASQSVISDDTWRIAFRYVSNTVGPFKLSTKAFPPDGAEGAQVRLWRHTYLDESLRILRAGREVSTGDGPVGSSDAEEFLFVTMKEA